MLSKFYQSAKGKENIIHACLLLAFEKNKGGVICIYASFVS